MQGNTAADTELAVATDIMDDDWKTRGGSIWNHGQERSQTRVKCRATTCQLVQLVKFMERHKELAVSYTQPFPGSEQLWEELTRTINQFGPPKTTKQCKTTWRDLRKRAFAIMRAKSKGKDMITGRNLYDMAPKIINLIAAAGGLPKGVTGGPPPEPEQSSQSSSTTHQAASPTGPPVDPLGDTRDVIKVDRTPSGNQLVIRVSDKLHSKTNVFNRFSVSDGHFENNIIVKEEREEQQPDNEESSENMETEEPREEYSQEDIFPAAEAVLGNPEEASDTCKALKELNETLRFFMAEYSERTQIERERLELDRERLQFEKEVFKSNSGTKTKGNS